MYTRLEDFPNELLLDIFEYLDFQDIFYGFWKLNQRLNQLLQSLENLSLTIEKDESKLVSLFGYQIKRLIVDTCLDIDFSQLSCLHTLILYQITEHQFKQIQSKFMPHLTYLSAPSEINFFYVQQLADRIFSEELPSLRYVHFDCIYLPFIPWSQSHSLHLVSIYCMDLIIVAYILESSPNLSTLHVHFEKNTINIFREIPTITNHPLKSFVLTDRFSVLCFKHIDTLLTLIPNVQRIQLNFNCDVPFIYFIRILSNRLRYLNRFNCHIDNAPNDEVTRIETIRQIHPCFKHIRYTTDEYGYRTYTTN